MSPNFGERWSNETEIYAYLERIRNEGHAVAYRERITEEMARDEAIMLGLRRREGLDLVASGKRFGGRVRAELESAARDLAMQGLGEIVDGRFSLNPKGMLLCDALSALLAAKAASVPG